MKIAFSTVGCPELSLDQVARSAADWGYQGVELRVSPDGVAATPVASDPMLAEGTVMHDLFEDAGVDLVSLATGVRFDKAVWPPVIGRLFQSEEIGVPETKAAVQQAARSGAFFVRVFGHQLPGGEPRAWGVRRVAERLALAAQTARNTSVRLLIENSGSFTRSYELAKLHGLVSSPYLSMSYNPVPAWMAGEDPVEASLALMDNLSVVKVGDVGEDGRPAPLGEGRLPIERFVRTLRDRGYRGWIVYEYPKLWRPELGETGPVLREAAERLYAWAGAPVGV